MYENVEIFYCCPSRQMDLKWRYTVVRKKQTSFIPRKPLKKQKRTFLLGITWLRLQFARWQTSSWSWHGQRVELGTSYPKTKIELLEEWGVCFKTSTLTPHPHCSRARTFHFAVFPRLLYSLSFFFIPSSSSSCPAKPFLYDISGLHWPPFLLTISFACSSRNAKLQEIIKGHTNVLASLFYTSSVLKKSVQILGTGGARRITVLP